MDEASTSAYLDRVRATVQEHGWAIQGTVVDGENVTYTVGLTAYGRNELVVCKVPSDLAGGVLNDLARRHITDPFAEIGVLWMFDRMCAVVEMPAPLAVSALTVARALYGDVVRATMIVIPHGERLTGTAT